MPGEMSHIPRLLTMHKRGRLDAFDYGFNSLAQLNQPFRSTGDQDRRLGFFDHEARPLNHVHQPPVTDEAVRPLGVMQARDGSQCVDRLP